MDKSANIQDNAIGFFQKAKTSFFDWLNSQNLNSKKIIEIFAFLGVGFIVGYFLKKYFKYVLLSLVVIIVAAFILDYSSIIHIDWVRIREILGIAPTDTIDSIFNVAIDWVKANIFVTVAAIVGFLLGYKLG